jgi:ketosteroid isomerase-like protein
MTEQEKRNLDTAHRYIELYNNDIERFVPECYTDDCRVYAMGRGVIDGPQQFLELEKAVLRAAPRRRMRLDKLHVTAETATVEVTLLDPDAGSDWELPFVAVLNMRDGKIAVDRSYADWSRWPGLESLVAAT